MSSVTAPSRARSSSWQERLHDHCRSAQLHPPVFNIVSDRRGGRTAWSSTVTLPTQQIVQARYWYDGPYVDNAKEDAAEVALRTLIATSPTTPRATIHGNTPVSPASSSASHIGWGRGSPPGGQAVSGQVPAPGAWAGSTGSGRW